MQESEPISSAHENQETRKKIPRFSEGYMNASADPWLDFYNYSNGSWISTNPIPKDKAQWSSFDELYEWNLDALRHILEEKSSKKASTSTNSNSVRDSPDLEVGNFYSSAMNLDQIEKLGFRPIHGLLQRIEGIEKGGERLSQNLAELHKAGVSALFQSYSRADKKNSEIYAFYLDQGGLSLPDREYYLSEEFSKILEQYREHVKKMFNLAGYGDESEKLSRLVVEFETKLAKSSRARADLRDEEKNYNKFTTLELGTKFPLMFFLAYLKALEVPAEKVGYVIIGQPEFFTSLAELLSGGTGLNAYLTWQVIHTYAPFLHAEVEKEDFEFFHRTLLGQPEPEPRWKTSAKVVDGMIGEALGKLYVEKYFPPEAARRTALMIEDIQEVFRARLEKLPWMTEETKKHALAKFSKFHVKIGHPEIYRDYSSIMIDPGDYVGNIMRASSFEVLRETKRVGSKVDKKEWLMTPPTVNAYFSPTENEIVFPAGILQPPFFDVTMDDAVNYGGIGSVIGHEITHGYDDQGRKFDGEGNLKDWWTLDDESEFKARAKEASSLYSSQEALPGLHVNGELTLGENIADFGGLSIAYAALKRRLEREPQKDKKINGLSPEQRFFISWAQIWRQNIREEELKRLLTIDPHAPCKYRAILPAINHDGFDEAFQDSSSHRQRSSHLVIW